MRAPARTFVKARRLRCAMTLPEVQLWQALRGSAIEGIRFRRQHPIGPYILDFYAPDAKLAVEVDGSVHDLAEQVERNRSRDVWLAEQDIRVMRFNAADILDPERRNDVVLTIRALVQGV